MIWCRDFDDGLLQKIPQIAYEDDIKDIPTPPDVSNYLVSEVSVYRCTNIHICCLLSIGLLC